MGRVTVSRGGIGSRIVWGLIRLGGEIEVVGRLGIDSRVGCRFFFLRRFFWDSSGRVVVFGGLVVRLV